MQSNAQRLVGTVSRDLNDDHDQVICAHWCRKSRADKLIE